MKATWENSEAGDTIGKEKQRHTPGPWELTPVWRDPELSGRGPIKQMKYRINVIARNGRDCPAITNGYTIEEAEANARLIAAAPDLLAACKAAMRLDYFQEHNALAKQMQEAIAKATNP